MKQRSALERADCEPGSGYARSVNDERSRIEQSRLQLAELRRAFERLEAELRSPIASVVEGAVRDVGLYVEARLRAGLMPSDADSLRLEMERRAVWAGATHKDERVAILIALIEGAHLAIEIPKLCAVLRTKLGRPLPGDAKLVSVSPPSAREHAASQAGQPVAEMQLQAFEQDDGRRVDGRWVAIWYWRIATASGIDAARAESHCSKLLAISEVGLLPTLEALVRRRGRMTQQAPQRRRSRAGPNEPIGQVELVGRLFQQLGLDKRSDSQTRELIGLARAAARGNPLKQITDPEHAEP